MGNQLAPPILKWREITVTIMLDKKILKFLWDSGAGGTLLSLFRLFRRRLFQRSFLQQTATLLDQFTR